jgi:ketosteroid isomerase-like protein
MTILRRIVVALLAFTFIQPTGDRAMAQSKTETEARNKGLVQTAFDAWKVGTGSPFDLLADDASWTIVGNSDAANTYPSKEAFLQQVIRPFNARMKEGIKPSIRGLYADGEAVIIFFDAAGTARDGKPYTNTYAWFFDMRDGKVVKASAFFDSVAFNDFWHRVSPDPAK